MKEDILYWMRENLGDTTQPYVDFYVQQMELCVDEVLEAAKHGSYDWRKRKLIYYSAKRVPEYPDATVYLIYHQSLQTLKTVFLNYVISTLCRLEVTDDGWVIIKDDDEYGGMPAIISRLNEVLRWRDYHSHHFVARAEKRRK